MGGNNIYTVLAFIAFLALVFGVGYVLWRHNQVFGDNPFSVPEARLVVPHATASA